MSDAADQTRNTVDPERGARAIQVLDEYLKRRAAGEAVTPAAFFAAYPDLANELREHLEIVEHLQPPGRGIEDLIDQGILLRSADPRYVAELGPYRIISLRGRGGMGVVLKAYEQTLNRTVALKILKLELAEDQAALARFEREAKAAAALRHPNIVTVYAIHKPSDGPEAHPTLPYIAMEYVDGQSLADVIRRGAWASGSSANHPAAGGSALSFQAAGFNPRGSTAHHEWCGPVRREGPPHLPATA